MRYFLFVLSTFFTVSLFSQSWKPVNGSRDQHNHYTAFTHANVFVKAGQELTDATLLIKNDKIVEVGNAVKLPPNTIEIDLKGKYIYPSFIDLYTQYGLSPLKKEDSDVIKPPQLASSKNANYYWNENIKPEVRASELVNYQKKKAEKLLKMGFGTVLTHQMDGIIRGTSTLLTLGKEDDFKILKADAAMQYAFFTGVSRQSYPNSLMGMIALMRQTHYDAIWYASDSMDYNASLEALVKAKELPKIIDAGSTLSQLRADKIGDEFNFQFILKGDGKEYQRIQEIKATTGAVIAPLNFPKAYDVSDPFDAKRLSFGQLKEWELADENLYHLQSNEIDFAITSYGLDTEKDFFKHLKRTVKKGLTSENAVKAMTETPARLLGVENIVGSLEKFKLANFIITSKPLFEEDCILHSNWVLGKQFEIEPEAEIDFAGTYSLNINKKLQYDLQVYRDGKVWKAKVTDKNKEDYSSVDFSHENNRISMTFRKKDVLYSLSGSASDRESRIWTGKTILNEKWVDWAAIKKNTKESNKSATQSDSVSVDSLVKRSTVYFPNKAYGWDSLPNKASTIIFRNATIWTNEEDGILKNHDLVIHDGKIKMVGYKINLEVMFPELAGKIQEIDASGKHLTCGIIDEHSHIAIDRGVNEAGQAITAEVSIADVIDSDDINIYRQLAGGVTSSQLLHGSANPIGGQSALIKLRWGQAPEKMKIEGADYFIKFALGENVKQSNWGDHQTVRFPQTRMGVEQVFYDAFTRAKEYKANWQLYDVKKPKDKKKSIMPRVDLELEALAEILDTQRFITCHSYMQSEINMLMHVADSMQFKVNTFTHVLEGYKVADKLKEHGAAASTFSDWWAYKFEVNDAIPFNGAMLHKQGVLTGFNSDDAEMGRRLNQEAAKAVKYGGLSEEEAWKLVTLNPAKMLHLEDEIGSIKPGKDADLVIWTENPLSVYAKVEQTYIDGIVYFDAQRDKEWRKKLVKERARIISKMLEAKKKGEPVQEVKKENKILYDCDTIEQ